METQLQVSINGQLLDRPYGSFPARSLVEGSIRPVTGGASGIYVVETQMDHYLPDSEAIQQQDGAEIDLGNLTTVTHRGVKRFSITMVDNVLYDCFNFHSGLHLDSARLISGTQTPPTRLTLEEIALLVVLKSGIDIEQVRGVKAQVIGDKVHLYNRQQLLHYGLVVGEMVATITQNTFGLIYSYKDPSRFFDKVTNEMFADNLKRLVGHQPPH